MFFPKHNYVFFKLHYVLKDPYDVFRYLTHPKSSTMADDYSIRFTSIVFLVFLVFMTNNT